MIFAHRSVELVCAFMGTLVRLTTCTLQCYIQLTDMFRLLELPSQCLTLFTRHRGSRVRAILSFLVQGLLLTRVVYLEVSQPKALISIGKAIDENGYVFVVLEALRDGTWNPSYPLLY